MVKALHSLQDVAGDFDVLVLDQWGVLHNGSAPYPNALATLEALTRQSSGPRLAVLSNSGKREALNRARIAAMGFHSNAIEIVMTSGEALWQDMASAKIPARSFFAIEGRKGDAKAWGTGLDIEITQTPEQADALLLMGLPDGTPSDAYDTALQEATNLGLPLYCSNPDFTSPRGGGYVMSPGALAKRYADLGGEVTLYGKPHKPIFATLETRLACPPDRILMIGDSLHHDIAGAASAGWQSALICAGIHAPNLGDAPTSDRIEVLANELGTPPPDFFLPDLR